MTPDQNSTATDGGPGFSMASNLANIDKIQRMWRAQWPEFSWLTVAGVQESRCYQMFAPDISRVGYGAPDASGNCTIYSIMCPQQGVWIPGLEATLNVEVTVTQSGGILNEGGPTTPPSINAGMSVTVQMWFSPDTMKNNGLIRALYDLFNSLGLPFASAKGDNSIKIATSGLTPDYKPTNKSWLQVAAGLDPMYKIPSFTMHDSLDENGMISWATANVAVFVGAVQTTGHWLVDKFNELVVDIFNLGAGNLLQKDNILSWNVWMIAPEEVYTQEWQMHADFWRFSLDVNHRSPEGSGRNPQYYDGVEYEPPIEQLLGKVQAIRDMISSNQTISKELNDEFDVVLSRNGSDKVTFL